MAKSRRIRDGLDEVVMGECEVEEIILCMGRNKAVEVHVPGIGIAVYDVAFSWINHSCPPNAFYLFSLHQSSSSGSQMLIVPAGHDEVETTKCIDRNEFQQKKGFLLKAMRQSVLWLKYRFICSCRRCLVRPSSYVDCTLQEIVAVNCESGFLSSDYEDEGNERFGVLVDDAINEYLMYGNPKSCCEKLERLLIPSTISL